MATAEEGRRTRRRAETLQGELSGKGDGGRDLYKRGYYSEK